VTGVGWFWTPGRAPSFTQSLLPRNRTPSRYLNRVQRQLPVMPQAPAYHHRHLISSVTPHLSKSNTIAGNAVCLCTSFRKWMSSLINPTATRLSSFARVTFCSFLPFALIVHLSTSCDRSIEYAPYCLSTFPFFKTFFTSCVAR
jgi:hypothetical protein